MSRPIVSRPIVWILLAIVALDLLFVFGPRVEVEVDTSLQPLELPVDLDAYLDRSEAQFDDIRSARCYSLLH